MENSLIRKNLLKILLLFVGSMLFLLCFSLKSDAAQLKITVKNDSGELYDVNDDNDRSATKFSAGSKITVTATENIKSLYLIWDKAPSDWRVNSNGNTDIFGKNGFLHEFEELTSPSKTLEITFTEAAELCDIYAFSDGELPSFVQKWKEPYEKADILVISTHADDEPLFFGGIIPNYTNGGDYRVQIAYYCDFYLTEKYRQHELLNGIWTMGVDHYPQLGKFKDQYSESLSEAKDQINYADAVTYMVETIRRFEPQVVLAQDFKGEYGHGQHMICAKAVADAIEVTNDASKYPDSAAKYGPWDVPKTYFHLYENNAIELDARVPLSDFGGKTALQVAKDAYQCHKSQLWCWFYVSDGYDDNGKPTDYKYSCTKFGLYKTTVGLDTGRDVMEHLVPYNEQFSTDTTEIYDAEDLKKISENPSGKYKLMCDVDLRGAEWIPINFSGTLNGNGHAILNPTIKTVTTETRHTYDGNMKEYDSVFSGFFGILENAKIKNLKILGENILLNETGSVFAGALAGYSHNSTVTDCEVESTVSLTVDGKSCGVSGLIGFGSGLAERCTVSTTLVFVDTNISQKDEQFMGGVNAAGHVSVKNCHVNIAGFDSDHGYVHNGGVTGMYILYDDKNYKGYVTDNIIKGEIKFFEDNKSRRAYCKFTIGEVMDWSVTLDGNADYFKVNEIFDYSKDLYPHETDGSHDEFDVKITAPTCTEYGFSVNTCTKCGYTLKTAFTPRLHNVKEFSEISSETDSDGNTVKISRGECSECHETVYVKTVVPKVEPTNEPTETDVPVSPATPAATRGTDDERKNDTDRQIKKLSDTILTVFVSIVAVLCVVAILSAIKRKKR